MHIDADRGEKYLTAREAARLLEVKTPTLYAYVSRGVVRSYRRGLSRRRLYLRREIESLRELRPARATAAPARIPFAEEWIGEK